MRHKSLILLLTLAIATLASCLDGNHKTASKSSNLNDDTVDVKVLAQWKAGSTVTLEQVEKYGIDKCFTSSAVDDQVWQSLSGNATTSRDHLMRIKVLHWGLDNKIHMGEMIASNVIADTLVAIFRQLYNAHYPIERMLPASTFNNDDEAQMRANNTSCYCPRPVRGTKVMSKHALAMAVDINPLYNPYYKKHRDGTCEIQPATAAPYCDRTSNFPCKIDSNDLAYKLFTAHGFAWGGNWKSCKDYQHFEWKSK